MNEKEFFAEDITRGDELINDIQNKIAEYFRKYMEKPKLILIPLQLQTRLYRTLRYTCRLDSCLMGDMKTLFGIKVNFYDGDEIMLVKDYE